MELFLFRHAEWERLYNCTGIDVDSIPVEQRRQFVPEACVTMTLCTIYYCLYVPCMFSLWKHRRDICYQLLFYIGATDLCVLWISGFLVGFLSIEGAVFCSSRVLIYWAGMAATCLWIAESTAELILGLNRCLGILSPILAEHLFAGWRTFVWLFLCTAYALCWLLFVKPATFTSLYFGWFYNPFVGYRLDTEGELQFNTSLTFATMHNSAIAVLSPLIYALFVIALRVKVVRATSQSAGISRVQKMAFLQVFIISSLYFFCLLITILMQFVETRQWLITLAEFAWFQIHGLPPVIYLCLNKTVRDDCREMFFKIFMPSRLNKVHSLQQQQGTLVTRRGADGQLSLHRTSVAARGTIQSDQPQQTARGSHQFLAAKDGGIHRNSVY